MNLESQDRMNLKKETVDHFQLSCVELCQRVGSSNHVQDIEHDCVDGCISMKVNVLVADLFERSIQIRR